MQILYPKKKLAHYGLQEADKASVIADAKARLPSEPAKADPSACRIGQSLVSWMLPLVGYTCCSLHLPTLWAMPAYPLGYTCCTGCTALPQLYLAHTRVRHDTCLCQGVALIK